MKCTDSIIKVVLLVCALLSVNAHAAPLVAGARDEETDG